MRSAKDGKDRTVPARMATVTLACSLLAFLVVAIIPVPAAAGSVVGIEQVKQAANEYLAGAGSATSAQDVTSHLNGYGAPSAPNFGPETVFNAALTNAVSVSDLSSTKFVVAYRDASDHGAAIIGNVSGSVVTFGSPRVFNAATTSYISTCALSTTKFAVAYRDEGNSYGGTGIIGDVAGNTITFGAETVFNSGLTNSISISALSASEFVVAYQDGGWSYNGVAIIGYVSGNTNHYGFEAAFNGYTDCISVAGLSGQFVVAYRDRDNSSYGTTIIGNDSVLGITYGAEKVFNTANAQNSSVAALSGSKFVVVYSDGGNSYRGTAVIGDVSGSSITCGSEKVISPADSHDNFVAALSSSEFAVAYGMFSGDTSDRGAAVVGDVSGRTVTCSSETVFSTGYAMPAISALSGSSNKFVIAYRDGGNSNYGTAVVGGTTSPTWFLAEGTTAWGFSCYISIENPNTSTVHAAITYMTSSGQVSGGTVTLPARSQATVNPASTLGQKDFSTRVDCTEGKTIAVDRTMMWTGPGAASPEAHSSVGVTAPSTTWYLPEGSSSWGFECWLLIQNPNTRAATCQVTYMLEGGSPVVVSKTIPASSRQTFNIANDIGQKDASIKVASNIPVIPERAMYRNNKREGHDSIGTTTPASDYYLAEGTTAWGFTTYVLVQNPNAGAANVTVTYMTPSGAKAQAPFRLAANSRKTIRVNDVAGMGNTDFSTQVHGSAKIIAERAMYWNNGTGEACHDSIGMDRAHGTFYLPDGQSSNGCETWTLVQNPNSSAVQVEISYLTPSGAGNVVKIETIPASSRQTFGMLSHSGINGRASIMVTSKTAGKPVMVERAMYWNNKGAGTDTIGGFSD